MFPNVGSYFFFAGFKWQRQLVFRSKLTMHTAYDRKDNAEPASITALAVSKWVYKFGAETFSYTPQIYIWEMLM